jgi:hypothetical protein
LEVGVAGLAGMAVSRACSVERSRRAGSLTACRLCVAWLSNDVPACRGLAVAWLQRGASATRSLELGVPATVVCPPGQRGDTGRRAFSWWQ